MSIKNNKQKDQKEKMEDKKQFFLIYNKIKKEEIDINSLNSEMVSRILEMLNEEIKINSKRIAQKAEEYERLFRENYVKN